MEFLVLDDAAAGDQIARRWRDPPREEVATMKERRTILVLSLALLQIACGPEPETKNHAPVIYNFVYQPNTISAGQDYTIFCSVDYEDPDADVRLFDYSFLPPNGELYEGEALGVEGEYGVTKGTADFRTLIHVTDTGDYLEEIWLIDEKGNESNRLQGTITVH